MPGSQLRGWKGSVEGMADDRNIMCWAMGMGALGPSSLFKADISTHKNPKELWITGQNYIILYYDRFLVLFWVLNKYI